MHLKSLLNSLTDASKVELLKAENRRLQSELTKPKLASDIIDADDESALKWFERTTSQEKDTYNITRKPKAQLQDDGDDDDAEPDTYASWDNDSVHEEILYTETAEGLPKTLADEINQTEKGIQGQKQEDKDVQNVVNLLENVSLDASMDVPSDPGKRSTSEKSANGDSKGGDNDKLAEQSSARDSGDTKSFSAPWKRSPERDGETSQQNGRQRYGLKRGHKPILVDYFACGD